MWHGDERPEVFIVLEDKCFMNNAAILKIGDEARKNEFTREKCTTDSDNAIWSIVPYHL